jgi:hypothetical protein
MPDRQVAAFNATVTVDIRRDRQVSTEVRGFVANFTQVGRYGLRGTSSNLACTVITVMADVCERH